MKTLTVKQKIAATIVAAMLFIYGIQSPVNVQAQDNAPELTPVSDRTQQVQDRIVALVPGVDSANDVTAAHLALITNLNLSDQSITALKAGDFDGLSALRSLSLAKNTLSSLPAGIFSGLSAMSSLDLGSNELSSLPNNVFTELSAMSRLNLSYNSLDSLAANTFSEMSALTGLDLGNNELSSLPANVFSGLSSLNWLSLSSNELSSLPDGLFSGLSSLNSLYLGDNTVGLAITMSLEKVGGNQFKATAPTGAPFNIVLPVTVTNGSIDGEATTITIAAGSTESGLLTVIPTPGTSEAVTVDIGTLPELPTSHFGYSLSKPSAADNTLSFALGIPKPTGDPKVNHAPIFTEGSSTTRSIAENTPAGTDIGSPVSATDEDEDVLTYTLSGADAASFGIVSTTGQLQTSAPLDYEKNNTYAVTVTVSDGSATDAISVTIDVTDVEENNDPVFVEGSATEREIPENTPAGRNIGAPVSATDLDEEDVLTYSLSGADAASFGIVSTTGQLRTRAPLDYEKKNTYSVAVHVSDGNGGTDTIGVAINVTDVEENNAPVFVEGTATERSVAENTPAGRNIGSPVSATDLDEDVLTYSLSGADAASFGIVSTTGQLRTRAPLDYEKKNTYSVAVHVSDGNGGTDSIGVAINVTDVEENNAPVFLEGTATERSIPENTPAGRNIGAPVTATDLDEADVLTYSLSGADAASFGIVSTTGQLRTRAPLDYEQKNVYSVAVLVSDGNGGTDSIGVAINITDVNETPTAHAPEFIEGSATERSIPENTPAGRNIGAPVTATDEDEDVLTYTLSGVDAASFGIVSTTGQLRTRAPLDYEQKNAYSVAVIVSDGTLTDTIGVAINVTDVAENNAPVFVEGSATERAIAENTPAGRNIGAPVTATDEDEDVLTYSLSGVDAASFGIVSTTGQLKTRAPLDYEQKNAYSVAVIVSDGTLTDTIGVAINVTDVAENRAPVFASSSTTRSIPENTPAGRNIGSPITATDEDGDSLTYALDGTDASAFGIVSTTGQLKTSAPLDYEEKNAYTVTVIASDGTLTDTINVAIKITDIDENTPPVFASSSTTRSIPENTPAGVHIGEAISAKDADTGDTLTYTLRGTDAAAFEIDSTTGQLKTKAPLDFETKNSYSVTVRASDGILTDTIRVTIAIIDVDEGSAPIFAGNRTTRFIKENTPAGVNIGTPVSATDDDEDTLTYTLGGLNAISFSIVSTTGQLKTKAPLDFEKKNAYTVTVTVSDGRRTDTITVAITIIDVDETPPTTDESPRPTEPNSEMEGLLLYWTADVGRSSTIRRMDLINGQIQDIVTGLGALPPNDIAVDPFGHKIYWSDDYLAERIQRANLDGTYRQDVVGNLSPTGIALDVLGGKIYWVDDGEGKIQRANLDGANVEDVITGLDDPTDVAIDVSGSKIYWTAGHSRSGKIQRANLDGANVEDVITGLDDPTYIAIDESGGKIYWVDDGEGKIQRANLDGTDIKDVVTGFIWSTGIALDVSGGKIYWTNTVGQKIQRANLDGANVEDVVTGLKINTLFPAISVAAPDKTTISTSPGTDVDEMPPTVDETPRPSQVAGVVSISEIMFGWERRFTPAQWIELHNAGPDIINLTGWKLIVQNVDSPSVTTIFADDFWSDAPRIWPNDTLLVVSEDHSYNSGNLKKDQIYDLDWRTELSLSAEGFYIKLIDDQGNLVDEVGNLKDNAQQWQLPYGENKGRTRDGHRTSMIRRYADSLPLDGTQAGSWISAADANLTEDQLTYYGTKSDISTPGIGILINEISTHFVEYDVNQDGVVDISDLVMVAGRLGQSGPNAADVNGDGFVNVQDLILVAGALGDTQAAPPLHPTSLEMFTAADIRGWLTQAQGLALTDPKLQSGIRFLEQLLSVLVPKETQLLPNYPNPFNPETWIPYRLAEDAFVTVTIYDHGGRVVRKLNVGHQTAAVYEHRSKAIYWDGRNEVGDKVASGIYFYTLIAGDYSATRKMLILK